MESKQYISITGMGIVSPAGIGISPLWEACLNKTILTNQGLGKIAEGNCLAYCLHSIREALNEAQWSRLNDDDVIILGTTTGQIGLWENDLLAYTSAGAISPALKHHPLHSLSEALKKALSFNGKIIITTSACSASTQAIDIGRKMILSGRAKRCLVGGVEELSQLTTRGFSSLKLLSTEPCKPFDQNRSGINLSEGAAFYTLEKDPQKRPLAYILSGATVLDSYNMTSPEPSGKGLKESVSESFKLSGISFHDIDFIHAHGTGSIHNDLAESTALSEIFPNGPEVLSTKGIHGHFLGASGAIELGICLQVFKHNLIPPVTGLEQKDSKINLNLPIQITSKKVKHILKTTLGFGGVNSVLALRSPDA